MKSGQRETRRAEVGDSTSASSSYQLLISILNCTCCLRSNAPKLDSEQCLDSADTHGGTAPPAVQSSEAGRVFFSWQRTECYTDRTYLLMRRRKQHLVSGNLISLLAKSRSGLSRSRPRRSRLRLRQHLLQKLCRNRGIERGAVALLPHLQTVKQSLHVRVGTGAAGGTFGRVKNRQIRLQLVGDGEGI